MEKIRRGHLDGQKAQAAIPARVRAILEAVENGAVAEETEFHGQMAVRVTFPDGAKQFSVLNDAALAAFRTSGLGDGS